MHGVVLFLAEVNVLSMLVNSVIAEHPLKELEAPIVFILHSRSVIEDADIGIVHLIVTNEEESWSIDWLFSISTRSISSLWHIGEVLLNQINQVIVIVMASSDDNHVVSIVVVCMIVVNIFSSKVASVISVTSHRLSHHVLPVSVEVSVLESDVLVLSVVSFVDVSDDLFLSFQCILIDGSIGHDASQDFDGLWHLV